MKLINKFILLIFMLGSGLSFSQFAYSETGLQGFNNMTKSITRLDTKKNWIQFSGTRFAYDRNTKIVDYKGNPVTEDQLKTGIYVTIKLNTAQRYISRPLLSEIRIETADAE